VAPRKAGRMIAAVTSPETKPGEGLVTVYAEAIPLLRDRLAYLGIKYEDFDALCRIADGLTGKCLGPSQVKRFGVDKFFDAIRCAGLQIRFEEDAKQTERMRKRISEKYLPRQANQARPNNEASPAGTHMMSRVFRHFAKLGGKARMAKMSPKERKAHQRMAALAKAKGDRKRRKALKHRRDREARKKAIVVEKVSA
jgi:hypothetical protein